MIVIQFRLSNGKNQSIFKLDPIFLIDMVRSVIKYLFYNVLPQKTVISYLYNKSLGRDINWKDPQDLNEKINWLKLHSDMSVWAGLADKHLVRNYVKERGLGGILLEEYGFWENANLIDFESLPNHFVLKTNHGCGTAIVVRDKSNFDLEKARKQLNKWLDHKYGIYQGERHYSLIKPVVVAVQLLSNDSSQSTSIIDYKVWCFNGRPYCICVCTDREIGNTLHLGFYDLNWNWLQDWTDGPHINDMVVVDKPVCLDEMLKSAAILAKGLPQVRVDFYVSGGKLYFGEMTLTSLGGYMNYIKPKYLLEMGEQIDLNYGK